MKKNRSYLFILVAAMTAFFASCSGNTKNTPMDVDELLTNAESFIDQVVIVEGTATHVCAKSGMKLFLEGESGGQTLRVESSGTLGKFDPEMVDQKVRVQGKLVEERIDEAYCQKLEEEIRNNTHVSHGEGGEGCATEQRADGVEIGSSEMERVNNFRARIAERQATEGKDYFSLYHIAAESYHIIE